MSEQLPGQMTVEEYLRSLSEPEDFSKYMNKPVQVMKVLVACEESQAVCKAFREKGHEAYSCDIEPCSGGHPEWHIQGDVLPLINGNCTFQTVDGNTHTVDGRWDILIAHPPCTYLTVTGNRWFNVEKYGEKAIKRMENREKASKFFMKFINADCQRIAVENPVGYMGSVYKKCDQIIQPYWFGDPYEKRTCLWLKNLPLLKQTNIVQPPERQKFESGKSMAVWYSKGSGKQRQKNRSKTFPGIAKAMADQWG